MPDKAACSGQWNGQDAPYGGLEGFSASGAASGTANYGILTSNAKARLTWPSPPATSPFFLSTQAFTYSQFNDILSFPNLPDGTSANLSATVEMSGDITASSPTSAPYQFANALVCLGVGVAFVQDGPNCLNPNNVSMAFARLYSVEGYTTGTAVFGIVGGNGSVPMAGGITEIAIAGATPPWTGRGTSSVSTKNTVKIAALMLTINGEPCGKECEIVTASGHKYPNSYVVFTPNSLNFGKVARGTTKSGSVTLTNLGATALSITNATLGGANSTDFVSEDSNPPCGGSVPAGGTCTLTFSFTPSIAGKELAHYSVYDSGGASPQKLTLTGTGQ